MNMTTCKTARQFSFPCNALSVLRNSLLSRNSSVVAAVADQGTEVVIDSRSVPLCCASHLQGWRCLNSVCWQWKRFRNKKNCNSTRFLSFSHICALILWCPSNDWSQLLMMSVILLLIIKKKKKWSLITVFLIVTLVFLLTFFYNEI